VVHQNPGLSNPDISKIIGRQWKALSDEEREKWNALAKVRHPYPNWNMSIAYHIFYRKRKTAINSNTLTTATSPSGPAGMAALVAPFRASVTILRDSQHVTDVVAAS